MAEANLLKPEVQARLAEVKQADILVGIPSYNNARTIGHVVRAATAGLAKYFPEQRSLVLNSDGGSKDGTPDVVANAQAESDKLLLVSHPVYAIHRVTTPYHGLPGKGSAFRTLFEVAVQLQVKACAVVDADLRSITPEWMELLLRPVLQEGYDYVAPYYRRHPYDGTITNSIVYPLTRALYGQRVRQPIGGDFGFSGALAQHYLTHDVWNTDVARYGIDIWMTTTALAQNFKVCQAFLGAKLHDPKDPGADLATMLLQVVGSVMRLMEEYGHVWRSVRGSVPTPIFGFQFEVATEPIAVNVDRMLNAFRQGCRDLGEIYAQVLFDDVLKLVSQLARSPREEFEIPHEVWVRTIHDFALAYHNRVIDRDHLLRSLTPLYLGWVASFVLATQRQGVARAEERVEALCEAFEQEKPYLVENWKA
ncbi:MAG: glycosyltransferase [Acidobacteria bacterium]|nr:glycosyltransferase [Acidobacteriota bacterium]